MKIFLSYPSEHDKSEGISYHHVLERLGHEVIEVNSSAISHGSWEPRKVVKGFPADTSLNDLIAHNGNADLFLYIEPEGLLPKSLEISPIPTACIICDCHRQLKPRQTLAKFFDHVFLYQRNYLSKFSDHPKDNVRWLPYACDLDKFNIQEKDRHLDIAFIGNLFHKGSERQETLNVLQSRYSLNEIRYYLQEEIPQVYSQAKIVLNLPVGDDLNFRFFEALSSKALLITKRTNNGQEELFKEDVHYVAFESQNELLEKIDYYLKNDSERERIALAGNEAVKSSHTLSMRVEELLETILTGPQKNAPIRNMSSNEVMNLYGQYYEKNGQIDSLLRLAAENKENGLARIKMLLKAGRAFFRRSINAW
jgi:hypothetical protein